MLPYPDGAGQALRIFIGISIMQKVDLMAVMAGVADIYI